MFKANFGSGIDFILLIKLKYFNHGKVFNIS